MLPTLVKEVAQKIREHIRLHPGSLLPEIKQLCSVWGVSRSTLCKGLALVRREGLLVSHGRGGVRAVSGTGELAVTADLSGVDRIYESVISNIESGKYVKGEVLPKLGFYALEFNVSSRGVKKAYERLITAGVVHQRGKRWIVGKTTLPVKISVGAGERPVVVIVLAGESSWRDLCSDPIAGRFAQRFNRECEKNAVTTYPVLSAPFPPEHLSGILPCGREAVGRFLNGQGERVRGFLLVGDPMAQNDPFAWAGWLAQMGKPVVLFSPRQLFTEKLLCAGLPRSVVECHCSERSAFKEVFRILSECKNTQVGVARQKVSSSSYSDRFDILLQTAASQSAVALHLEHEQELFWERRSDGQTPGEVIERLRKKGLPVVRKILANALAANPRFFENSQLHTVNPNLYDPAVFAKHDMALIWNTHLLVPLLRKHNIGTLLAINDESAVAYYYWLKAAGIQVPQELSLISFDNSDTLSPLPVSSVDFGLDTMGYQAVQVLLGDLPVALGRNNCLVGPVTLIDRGSVGQSQGMSSLESLRGEIR